MPKVVIAPIGSVVNQTSFLIQLNNALQKLAAAFDDTLSRDDTVPNQMEAALDMNSNPIINVPNAVNDDEAVNLRQLHDVTGVESNINDLLGLTLTNPRNLDFIRYSQTDTEWENTRTADLPLAQQSVGSESNLIVDRSIAEVWTIVLSDNVNISLQVSNWGPAGQMSRLVLQITNAGGTSITSWPNGTVWPSGIPPILSANGFDLIILTTFDGGTTIFGNVVGLAYS